MAVAGSPAEESAPLIRTPPPGPRCKEFFERQQRVAWSGALDTMPIAISRKHGSVLEDLDGNLLVDMVTGWGSTNVGATHPDVVEPTVDAIRRYGHEISDYISSEPVLDLASKLVEISPAGLTRVSFEVSGTEAVESAMKFMRARTGRPFILTFLGQYHGESYGAQAVGAQISGYSRHMRELMGGFVHVPYPNPYRCPFHRNEPCDGVCVVDYLRDFILPQLMAADRIAGVMIEPIAGEAGVLTPPDPFWPALLDLCAEHGWLLCADEVQTAFGRTGPMFAVEHWGIEPDLMCLAKGLSGGVMPIGATLGTENVMGDTEVFVGGTYAWQPPACVAALAGIEVIEKNGLLDSGRRLERMALEAMPQLADRYGIVGDVRIKGLYIAVEFVKEATKEKAPDAARAVHFACLKRGVVDIYDKGTNFLRWQPALNMPEEMFAEAMEILAESVAEVSSS